MVASLWKHFQTLSLGLLFYFFRIICKLFWESFMPIKSICLPYNVQNSNTLTSQNWKQVWKCKSTKKLPVILTTRLTDPWDKRTWLGFIKPQLKEQFFKSWHLQLIFNNFTFLFSVTCVCEGFWAMPAWVKTFFRIHSAYQIG